MRTWTRKNGETIAIKDMKTSHLRNTIALLERAFHRYQNSFATQGTFLQGEMASLMFDQALDELQHQEVGDIFPEYDWLVEELETRPNKIDVDTLSNEFLGNEIFSNLHNIPKNNYFNMTLDIAEKAIKGYQLSDKQRIVLKICYENHCEKFKKVNPIAEWVL